MLHCPKTTNLPKRAIQIYPRSPATDLLRRRRRLNYSTNSSKLLWIRTAPRQYILMHVKLRNWIKKSELSNPLYCKIHSSYFQPGIHIPAGINALTCWNHSASRSEQIGLECTRRAKAIYKCGLANLYIFSPKDAWYLSSDQKFRIKYPREICGSWNCRHSISNNMTCSNQCGNEVHASTKTSTKA